MGQEGDDWRDMRELFAQRKAEAAPRKLPKRTSANPDRPLTKGEKQIWTRKAGFTPGPNATLRHFRRGMGGGGWSSQK